MENSIIKIENLSHKYSIQWAVKDINLEIKNNGIYGLLGSNGAGKSTIMNIICGVIKPTNGNIFIQGVDLCKEPVEAKRNIGFLPQKPPLHVDLTIEEYLTHCANMRHMNPKIIKQAVDSVLEKCAITHFRKRLIRNLSGGYQQRVGIAQAIIHNPAFVVLDEPTNGLDPNQILEIRKLIKEIADERTVIVSTHILSEVQATCDFIYMIEQGKMVFEGTVYEFDNYIEPNTLLVTMLSPPAIDELKQLEGVQKVEELNTIKYRISFNNAQDVVDQLIENSYKKNWRIAEIIIEKNSLDSIFAELSKK